MLLWYNCNLHECISAQKDNLRDAKDTKHQHKMPVVIKCLMAHKCRGGHVQLFFESAIAIPQLEGSASAIAIPQLFKEMLLRNRNSAIPQSQFFLKPATLNQQLESFTSAIFGIFLALE
jgi:hypothetical protein